MKTVKNERHKAKDVEMNGARSVPTFGEDKKPDEEIQQRSKAKIIFNRGRIILRCGDQRYVKRFTAAPDAILHFCPWAGAKQQLGNVHGAMDGRRVKCFDIIALLESCAVGRSSGSHVPGHHDAARVHPGYAVIGNDETRALLEVQNGKDPRRQRQKCQDNCTQPYSKIVVHPTPPETLCDSMLAR